MENDEDFYPLYSDLIAKFIFGTNINKAYTASFLEAYFDVPEGTYQDLDIKNSVLITQENVMEHGLEMDIVVNLPDGTIINLEFYSVYTIDFRN